MKELLVESSDQLQSSDASGSIAWAPDNMFAKVMGKERKGHIREVGFGLTAQVAEVTRVLWPTFKCDQVNQGTTKASLAEMQEKLSAFDEMKERLSQFEEMGQRMARMLQQMQQITSQCSQVGINVCLIPLIGYFGMHKDFYL